MYSLRIFVFVPKSLKTRQPKLRHVLKPHTAMTTAVTSMSASTSESETIGLVPIDVDRLVRTKVEPMPSAELMKTYATIAITPSEMPSARLSSAVFSVRSASKVTVTWKRATKPRHAE